ncbi:MAG: protein kinase [Planctomycetes bacterium]|nr:protein kinase [Planctomycetota bacterium]
MERPDRTKDVFIAGLSIAAGERRTWLAQQCAGDEALLARVLELFAAHDNAGSFLAEPGDVVRRVVAATVDGSREKAGETIGAYKLLENIGEGGFGTVWMAEQREPVRRLVALKVLKAGMDSAQVVARFEQERQALALMTHPNIAQVFDAGTTPRGLPFFVMELVKGVPVTDYCAREKLPIRARLDLFVQVCRAVQHAHGKGLIHRDIKPRNVLVATADGKPLAKVIDFGIAKATAARLTDKTLFTEHRAMVGTLEYMSPEQAQGLLDVDTRSDVYSLGALLYELLTGSTPFDAKELVEAGYAEILRILRDVEPQRPSVRVSTKGAAGWVGGAAVTSQRDGKELFGVLRGELDWVVMKALEKDRGRRYASADGLAEDVERYLAGDPVRAVPPSIGYRIRKFVRRNKAVVGSSAAILLTVFVAVVLIVATEQRVAGNARARQILAELADQVTTQVKLTKGIGSGEQIGQSIAQFRYSEDAEGDRTMVNSAIGFLQGALETRIDQIEAQRDVERIRSYASRLNASLAYLAADLPALARHSLDQCPDALLGWESRHASAAGLDGKRLLSNKCECWEICGDRERLAYWDGASVSVVRLGTWREEGSVSFAGDSRGVRLHFPSLHRLVIEKDGCYTIIDPIEGSVRPGMDRAARAGDSTVGHDREVTRVATGNPRRVSVWDVESGALLGAFESEWSTSWEFSSDGRFLVCVGREDRNPRSTVWRVTDGLRVAETKGALVLNPFGHRSVSTTGEVVDLESGSIVQVPALAARDFHYIGADLVIKNALTGSPPEVRSLSEGREIPLRGTTVSPDAVEFVTPDLGRRVLPDYWGEGYIVSCTATGEPLPLLPWSELEMSGDGKWFVGRLGSYAPLIALPARPAGRAVVTHHPVLALANAPSAVGPRTMARSRSKSRLFDEYTGGSTETEAPEADVAVGSQDGTRLLVRTSRDLFVVDAATSQPIAVLSTDAANTLAIALNHDGSIAVACDAEGIHWWNLAVPGESKRIAFDAPLNATPFIAVHGTAIAVSAGDTVRLFSSDTGRLSKRRTLEGESITCSSFQPDGARLFVGTASGRLHVLAVPDLWTTVEMTGHVGSITATAATSDGGRVFTAGVDGTVRVWHSRPPEMPGASTTPAIELLSLSDPEITGKPTCLLFPPDGERLICGYDDGSIRVWDSVPWSERVDRRNAAVGWPVQKK